jgi:two-component system response regulator EvgA
MSTIFIVDDHPVSQLAVQVVANGKGYDVVGTCDNGHDALVYLRNHRPDLVVIDIDIPPPDGLEVIKRLREENYPGGIIVLTTHSDQHFVDRVRLQAPMVLSVRTTSLTPWQMRSGPC